MFYAIKLTPSLSAGLFEVRHDEWPDIHNVSDNLNQRMHLHFVCDDGATETGSRHHPITIFCPFHTSDDKFRQKKVQATKHR